MIKSEKEKLNQQQIQELKQQCLDQANQYLKELGYTFIWDSYDKYIQQGPRKTRFDNFGYYYCFNDRGDVLRFWTDYFDTSQGKYYIFYSEGAKSQIQPKPWRIFNNSQFKLAKDLFNFLEISRQNISKYQEQKQK